MGSTGALLDPMTRTIVRIARCAVVCAVESATCATVLRLCLTVFRLAVDDESAPDGPCRPLLRIPFRGRLPQPSLHYPIAHRPVAGRRRDHGEPTDRTTHVEVHPWWKVIWLTGVDYFSTLGISARHRAARGRAVAPIATVILVLVTLFGALPVYAQVAGRSYAGQGSIAMLENLLTGWKGKLLVLVLLGFAATDFVITMTLSAADAAKHAIENPFLHPVARRAPDPHHARHPRACSPVVFLTGLHAKRSVWRPPPRYRTCSQPRRPWPRRVGGDARTRR